MIKYLLSLALMLYAQYSYGYTWKVQSKEYSIETDKVAYVNGVVDESTYFTFKMDMLQTTKLPGARLIIINSPGGVVKIADEMVKIMDDERKTGVKEVCLVNNQASSAAFNFLTHCDIRLAVKGSSFLIHKTEDASTDAILRGVYHTRETAYQLRLEAARLDKTDEPYRQANAKAMHMNLDDYDFCANKETLWHSGALHVRGYLTGIATIE